MRSLGLSIQTAVALMLATTSVGAHTGSTTDGFFDGFGHPIFGADHVVAMVAVALWGAFLGAPAIFVLPIVFPLVMAFGGILGILGVPLPGTASVIAASAVALGLMVAFAATALDGRIGRWYVRDLSRPRAWD